MQKVERKLRTVIVVDNSAVARAVGARIRDARVRARLTQAEVARGRYTAAYISALERGLAKPSMAALTFISERLGVPITDLVAEERPAVGRLEADLLLAAGSYQEALDRYDALLEAADGRRTRAELLRGRAEALCRLGRGAEAVAPASEAAEVFAGIGLQADAAWARYWLAYAHYQLDNPAEARAILHDLLAAERGGLHVAPDFRFRLLTSLGHVEVWDGQPERALAYMEEARALTEDLSLTQRAAFLSGLALQYREAGDLEGSIRAGTESLALYRAADAEREEAALQINLGLTYLQLGNRERASEHLQRARELADIYHDVRLDSDVAEAEAQLAFELGDEPRAADRIAAALDAAGRGGSYLAAVGAHRVSARLARRGGEIERARKSYEKAAEMLRAHQMRSLLRDLLAEWAELLVETGDSAAANELYAEALGRRTAT